MLDVTAARRFLFVFLRSFWTHEVQSQQLMVNTMNPVGQETKAPNSYVQTNHFESEAQYAGHGAEDSGDGHRADEVKTSVLGFAVALTLGFSVVELAGGFWSNSLALIGDAGHMVTDSASLLFALIANIVARRGVDNDHSFGHGRIEVLAAFVNGIAMLGVVLWLFFEAYQRFSDPPEVAGGSVMIVAVIGLVINVLVALSLSRDKKNVNTRSALVHVMGDLLGSVAAILSGALIYFGGARFALADPILSVLVGLLVLHATWGVFRDTTRVLMDGVPEGVNYADVGDTLLSVKGVEEVHDLHVWTMAPEHSAVMAHLRLAANTDWPQALSEARELLKERFGIDHVTLQPENEAMSARCCRTEHDICGFRCREESDRCSGCKKAI